MKTIGVLALQGCVQPHRAHIEALGAKFLAVKTKKDLEICHGMILPGGESSTQLKLLKRFDLWEPLRDFAQQHPTWGICAGSILLCNQVIGVEQDSLGLMSFDAARNDYGRQVFSFQQKIGDYEVAFIRAPKFYNIDQKRCEVLNKIVVAGGEKPEDSLSAEAIVCLSQEKLMATSFHPELNHSYPSPWHRRFFQLLLETSGT